MHSYCNEILLVTKTTINLLKSHLNHCHPSNDSKENDKAVEKKK